MESVDQNDEYNGQCKKERVQKTNGVGHLEPVCLHNRRIVRVEEVAQRKLADGCRVAGGGAVSNAIRQLEPVPAPHAEVEHRQKWRAREQWRNEQHDCSHHDQDRGNLMSIRVSAVSRVVTEVVIRKL